MKKYFLASYYPFANHTCALMQGTEYVKRYKTQTISMIIIDGLHYKTKLLFLYHNFSSYLILSGASSLAFIDIEKEGYKISCKDIYLMHTCDTKTDQDLQHSCYYPTSHVTKCQITKSVKKIANYMWRGYSDSTLDVIKVDNKAIGWGVGICNASGRELNYNYKLLIPQKKQIYQCSMDSKIMPIVLKTNNKYQAYTLHQIWPNGVGTWASTYYYQAFDLNIPASSSPQLNICCPGDMLFDKLVIEKLQAIDEQNGKYSYMLLTGFLSQSGNN